MEQSSLEQQQPCQPTPSQDLAAARLVKSTFLIGRFHKAVANLAKYCYHGIRFVLFSNLTPKIDFTDHSVELHVGGSITYSNRL